MSSANGRGGRRRRILNDGRMTDEIAAQANGENEGAGGTPRFAPPEGSVSFGIARRLLPIGGASLCGIAIAGTAAIAGLVALDKYQVAVTQAIGVELSVQTATPLDLTSPNSLAVWLASSLALAIAGLSAVVFGLRRHRSDDLTGVYRWWMPAGLLAVATSVCLATGMHHVVATAIGEAVGWSPLAGHAFWWLMPAVAFGGPVAAFALLDLRESKFALGAASAAMVSVVIALCAHMGWAPGTLKAELPVITAAALLVGLLSVAWAQLAYARRMVLEADGKVSKPEKPVATLKMENETAAEKDNPKKTATAKLQPAKAAATKPSQKKQQVAAESTQWVDGSQGDYGEAYDDDEDRPRKLTKAERKRLRRLKERQNRAA